MKKRGHQPEQIIYKFREAEILLAKGETIGQACRKIGVTEQTYYRWRREFGGLTIDQAKRFREIERENSQLKKLVADLSVANAVLKEVAQSKL